MLPAAIGVGQSTLQTPWIRAFAVDEFTRGTVVLNASKFATFLGGDQKRRARG